MQVLVKLRRIFDRSTKLKFLLLLVAIIIGSFLETAALSVMYPFIQILTDSSVIESNSILNTIYNLLSLDSHTSFLAFFAFLLALVYIVRSTYLYIVTKIQYRFLARRQVEMSQRLLSSVLAKSYLYHVSKNLADFQRIISSDSYNTITLVTHFLTLVSDFFMTFFIVLFLLIQSPSMTLVVIGMSLACILLYYKVFRNRVSDAGEENRVTGIAFQKAMYQAVGGIKELKILRREGYFVAKYKTIGKKYAKANQRFQVYNTIPGLLITAVCYGGASILIGTLILTGIDIENTVPLLALFVVASTRLFPAVTRLASNYNSMIFLTPSVDKIYSNLFELDDANDVNTVDTSSTKEVSPDIIVENLFFQYPNTNAAVLSDVSLHIPYKQSVAFVGPTGAGKTTLVDIILGIYQPQSGGVYYNGKSVHHNMDEWTKHIGYIPQQIYLLDETIIENVAYGIPQDEIDEKRVWESLEQAQLADFVRSLPDGLNTIVGDRGVRLSGGQRQRIGIARALYISPSILVLDEATSSLDNETEKAVMEAIEMFQGEKTMIIIAHRLSTVESCDTIYRVDGGKVTKEK